MNQRVFVTQETLNLNYSGAEEFGSVEFLVPPNVEFSPMKNSLSNSRLSAEIARKLMDFNPEFDWLVISGSPITSAFVFLHLGSRGFKRVRMLRWSNRDHAYTPMTLELQ